MTQLRRAVILGSSGFIGSALEQYLHGLGQLEVHGFSSESLDLRHFEALAALDEVVDETTALFVVSGVTPDRGINLDSMASNLAIATNVARYLEQHATGKVVYFSTDAVYPADADHITEDTPAVPGTLYSVAKLTGERALEYVSGQRGFPLLILRPAVVYGPGNTHGSYGPNQFVRTALADRRVRIFGDGEELRDHPYIDDAVRLIWTLAASPATGVYNLATGQERSFGSIVELLKELAPFDFELVKAPRSGPIVHRRFDVAKLRAAVPDFQFTSFEEGLRKTLAHG